MTIQKTKPKGANYYREIIDPKLERLAILKKEVAELTKVCKLTWEEIERNESERVLRKWHGTEEIIERIKKEICKPKNGMLVFEEGD